MGGNKKPTGLKKPLVYHSSIPAHIRSIAQNITGGKISSKNILSDNVLEQSVGFIAESPTKTYKKIANVKKNLKSTTKEDQQKKSSPGKYLLKTVSPTPTPTSPVSSCRRPTSLQTNVSSGYESEYQSSDVGSCWEWTAAEVLWKWQNNNLKTKKVSENNKKNCNTSSFLGCTARHASTGTFLHSLVILLIW